MLWNWNAFFTVLCFGIDVFSLTTLELDEVITTSRRVALSVGVSPGRLPGIVRSVDPAVEVPIVDVVLVVSEECCVVVRTEVSEG